MLPSISPELYGMDSNFSTLAGVTVSVSGEGFFATFFLLGVDGPLSSPFETGLLVSFAVPFRFLLPSTALGAASAGDFDSFSALSFAIAELKRVDFLVAIVRLTGRLLIRDGEYMMPLLSNSCSLNEAREAVVDEGKGI